MELNPLIQSYAERKGLKKIALSEEGIGHLVFQGSLVLTFEQSLDGQSFFIYAGLGEVLPGEEKAVYEEMLAGNLFGGQTGRASLGRVPDTNILILFEYFDPAAWDLAVFDQEIDLFCRYLLFWIEKIQAVKLKAAQSLSLQSHLKGLQDAGKMRIFFA